MNLIQLYYAFKWAREQQKQAEIAEANQTDRDDKESRPAPYLPDFTKFF